MSPQLQRRISLSLVVPCFNESATLETCIRHVVGLAGPDIELEIIIVDDGSTDGSAAIANQLAKDFPCVKTILHERNFGKGRAIRTGIAAAKSELIGIQDADLEYDPLQYRMLIGPILDGRADVVYGSRFLKIEERRVLYFWHSWMNRTLTSLSNMFTNLDLTDMETCFKLFKRDIIQSLFLKEDRFGFEPEVTIKIAETGCKIYECAISYRPRSYEEGKKINWKDGVRALYCILHYGGPSAPIPMQLIIYFFIGFVSALANLAVFAILMALEITLTPAVIIAFVVAAAMNYLLCIKILFKHKARWSTAGELTAYVFTTLAMGLLDLGVTAGLVHLGSGPVGAKIISNIFGFFGNFAFRRLLVFPKRLNRNTRTIA